jgi:hypothetical protein
MQNVKGSDGIMLLCGCEPPLIDSACAASVVVG